jgi:hypothetical protein
MSFIAITNEMVVVSASINHTLIPKCTSHPPTALENAMNAAKNHSQNWAMREDSGSSPYGL